MKSGNFPTQRKFFRLEFASFTLATIRHAAIQIIFGLEPMSKTFKIEIGKVEPDVIQKPVTMEGMPREISTEDSCAAFNMKSKTEETWSKSEERYQLFQNLSNNRYAWFRVGTDRKASQWYRTLDEALNWSSADRTKELLGL